MIADLFVCPNCGKEKNLEDLEYSFDGGKRQLNCDATLTCPVCKSKFAISALLTEPGDVAAGATPAPPTEEPTPEEPGEEAGEGPPPEGATVSPEGPEQIGPKGESVDWNKRAHEIVEGKEEKPITEQRYDDLTPSPREYRHALQIIIKHCKDKASKQWAQEELADLKGVSSWKRPMRTSYAQDRFHGEGKVRGIPDGTGSYGRGMGPGRGRADGTGMRKKVTKADLEKAKKEGKYEGLQIHEKKDEDYPKEWEGDFDVFNAKLFGVAGSLDIDIESIEDLISDLTDDDALSLDNDKVKLDLQKAHKCLVDFLNKAVAEPMPAPETVPPTPPLGTEVPEEPRPETTPEEPGMEPEMEPAPTLGSTESVSEAEEENEIENKVTKALQKYFA